MLFIGTETALCIDVIQKFKLKKVLRVHEQTALLVFIRFYLYDVSTLEIIN